MHDPHRFVNDLDEFAHEKLISRLESRAQDKVFSGLIEKYLSQLQLDKSKKVLEIGCGTGVVLRSLVRNYKFEGEAYGVDQCGTFINAAGEYSEFEGVGGKISFSTGDAHHLEFSDETFDLVLAHTLLSHVTEPAKVVSEMSRVLRRGGRAVIFDGDYSSLTYAFPDHSFGLKIDEALANNTFNNPRIMCDLPRLLPPLGLSLEAAWGDAVVEIGKGSYFKTFAETYIPYVKEVGMVTERAADIWMEEQYRAMESGTFFAACNYYTYIVTRL